MSFQNLLSLKVKYWQLSFKVAFKQRSLYCQEGWTEDTWDFPHLTSPIPEVSKPSKPLATLANAWKKKNRGGKKWPHCAIVWKGSSRPCQSFSSTVRRCWRDKEAGVLIRPSTLIAVGTEKSITAYFSLMTGILLRQLYRIYRISGNKVCGYCWFYWFPMRESLCCCTVSVCLWASPTLQGLLKTGQLVRPDLTQAESFQQ